MKIPKIQKIKKFIAIFFCLAIFTQNGVEAPVLCFETDGHINLEAGCDISCKIPPPKNDEHQDDCDNCFDIHLWNYNPNLNFLTQTVKIGYDEIEFNQIISIQPQIQVISTEYYTLENLKLQLPPFLKTTRLLI
ncbi:MAG: hypothetical protein H8E72_00195 [Candidatus Marinimicrobia bacterium]|nr:hypothetical protein [Candidatus Neomarinimicrobiota bacterium]